MNSVQLLPSEVPEPQAESGRWSADPAQHAGGGAARAVHPDAHGPGAFARFPPAPHAQALLRTARRTRTPPRAAAA